MKNSNLAAAKRAKNDEFYTCREDIEVELAHYAESFRGKTVYCNCDDPDSSEFWRFFQRNFNAWGLKRLIATHYEPDAANYSYMLEMNPGDAWDGTPVRKPIQSNGDFRSAACIELLEQADIVVTNPPFSLFREYVAQLMAYDKKFLIIGNINVITYKEIFPLIRSNQIWPGFNEKGGTRKGNTLLFGVPDTYESKSLVVRDGKRYMQVSAWWFTNLDHKKRHQPLDLRGVYYDPNKYPKYDNYDAIEVSKTADIPCDYDGVMGVPITFLDKYCPEQFEILGLLQSSTEEQAGIPILRLYDDFKEMRQDMTYTGASGKKANGNPVLQGKSLKGNFLYNPYTGEYCHSAYARIVIRRC